MSEYKKIPQMFRPGTMIAVGLVVVLGTFLLASKSNYLLYGSLITNAWFYMTIVLGGLFIVILHHLVSAKWSVVLRRFFENLASSMPVLAVVFAPLVYFNLGHIYKWANPEIAAQDHLIQKKAGYLNPEFFTVRMIIFLVVWCLLAYLLRKFSVRHDESKSEADLQKMRNISAVGALLYALTITFASFDWIMSLDPHWYSTIFGIYNFAGALVSSLAFTIICVWFLQKKGFLTRIVTIEHFHDLGKMLFAFTCFWAYIAFSQYVLIWYANIPEETIWYAHRWEGTWKYASLALAIGHFVIPFVFLLPRSSKRSMPILLFFSFWMLIMHYLDLSWLVNPNFAHHGIPFSWFDVGFLIGFGALLTGALFWNMGRAHLYPISDPILSESKHLKNY